MPEPFPPCPGVRFRDIPGFPGYAVGDDGSVWSRLSTRPGTPRAWKPLTPSLNAAAGAWRVRLRKDGRTHSRYVAGLVLEAFAGPRPPGARARRGPDPDPANNRTDNLRWGLPGGDSTGRAKLTEAGAAEARRLVAGREPRRVVAALFGVSVSALDRAVRGTTWGHVPPAPPSPGDPVWSDW